MIGGILSVVFVCFLLVGVWKGFPYLLGIVLFVVLMPVYAVKGLIKSFDKESPVYKWRYVFVVGDSIAVFGIGFILYAEYFHP